MATIPQLSATDQLTAGDLLPVYVQANGDARKASMTRVLDFVQSNLVFPAAGIEQFVVQYATPNASGFSVSLQANDNNQWLILSPTGPFAAGTIVFPAPAVLVDGQEIIISCTQTVTTLTLNGNGATVFGAVPTITSYAAFRYKYNALVNGWYRLDSSTLASAGVLAAANNLSDVASVATSRTNLGVSATGADTTYNYRANNLSDVANALTARANLGVGTANSPQFAAINVGNASDTTISRVSAGVIAVAGSTIYTASNLPGTAINWTAAQVFSAGQSGRVLASSETTGTLTAASANRTIQLTGDITINAGVFTTGDMILVYAGASARTVTQGGGVTMRLDGTATTGNRTVAARGIGILYFVSASEVVVSGGAVT